eukprot:29721-Prymnesium_polylepis.1
MCQRRRAASSRTPVWRRAAGVSAARAHKSKPAVCDAGHEASTREAVRGAAPYLAGAPAARGSRAERSSVRRTGLHTY